MTTTTPIIEEKPITLRSAKTEIRVGYSDSGVMILTMKQKDDVVKCSVTGKTGQFMLRGDRAKSVSLELGLLDKIHKLAGTHFGRVTTMQSAYPLV